MRRRCENSRMEEARQRTREASLVFSERPAERGCGSRAVGQPSVEMAKVWGLQKEDLGEKDCWERDDGAKFLHKERLRA